MSTRKFIVTTLFLQALLGIPQKSPAANTKDVIEAATMNVKSPVDVTLTHSVADGQLSVQYSVTNHSDKPIFIFDRLWSNKDQKIDENWAYVTIAGKTAIFRRLLELMPRGVRMETPPEPYGREIAPGSTSSGSFRIRLPIAEGGPFDRMLGRRPDQTVLIEKIKMEIGWCPKSELERGLDSLSPVKSGKELLWPFAYGQVKGVQKTVRSASRPAQLNARILSPR